MVDPSPRDKSKFLHVVGLLAASVIEPFPGTIKVYVVKRVDGVSPTLEIPGHYAAC